jgi:hypothetical protein
VRKAICRTKLFWSTLFPNLKPIVGADPDNPASTTCSSEFKETTDKELKYLLENTNTVLYTKNLVRRYSKI